MLPRPAKIHDPSLLALSEREEPLTLVAVCAWCGCALGKAEPTGRRVVSHGMCRPCLDELFTAQSHGTTSPR